MKRLVIDIDGTLTIDDPTLDYRNKLPNISLISKLREYKERGFEIILFTSRNMRTYDGNVGLINVHTLPVIIDWLHDNNVPYDEIHVGKPWCGHEGFHVDDKAIRPDEFVSLRYDEIGKLIKLGRNAV
ncbi:hypothetical protein [Xanthobacter sediminis]